MSIQILPVTSMQNQLKVNLLSLAKQKGVSMRKVERDAGLHKNFISNFLHDKSKSPGIESIAKIAAVLDVSIDELVGRQDPKYPTYSIRITREDILHELILYLLEASKLEKKSTLHMDKFFKAIYEIYTFSLTKGAFDKDFADWFINSVLMLNPDK